MHISASFVYACLLTYTVADTPLPTYLPTYTQPYRTHKLRDTGRSVVHSNVVALLGDFAGGVSPASSLSGAADDDVINSPSSSAGRSGRYNRKRGGGGLDDGMLAGVGRGAGRPKLSKLLGGQGSHNETLSSFP